MPRLLPQLTMAINIFHVLLTVLGYKNDCNETKVGHCLFGIP